MSKPKGHEIEYEGEIYTLVDSALLVKLNPGRGACGVCALLSYACGKFDCVIEGPEVGVYVKKLKEG